MDLEAAFAMEQMQFPKRYSANSQFIGFDFPSNATSKTTDQLPFSLFDNTMGPMPSNPSENSSEMLDSDDDFGDFKSVPAGTSAPIPQKHDKYDTFDVFPAVSASNARKSRTIDNSFGELSCTNGHTLRAEGEETVSFKLQDASSADDDDWGDFVEHSGSTTREEDFFHWFDTSTQSVEVPLPPKVDPVSSDLSSSSSPFTWFGDVKLQELQALPTKSLDSPVNDVSLLLGPKERNNAIQKDFFLQESENLANGSIISPLECTLSDQKVGHNRRGSAIENASTPIPLSLFGEEELENVKDSQEIRDNLVEAFHGQSKDKVLSRKNSLPSGAGNLVDLISSLYDKPLSETQYTVHQGAIVENKSHTTKGNDINEASCGALHVKDTSCSLDVQLFDLTLVFRKPKSFCQVAGCMENKDNIDMERLRSVNYDQLLPLLIEEGRIHEVLSCREHARLVQCWSSLMDAYNLAQDVSEDGKAASIQIEMKEIQTRLAKGDEVDRWQKRGDNGRSLMALPANGLSFPCLSTEETASFQACLCHTYTDMVQKLGRSSSDARAMVFEAEFQPKKVFELATRDMNAAIELLAQAASTFWVLACASVDDQCAYVRAWEAMLAVCASELEHAGTVWEQAKSADVHLDLLTHLEGKRYFAAIGQVYAASLILAAASNTYRPWLAVAAKEGTNVRKSLEQCKSAWMGTNLKDGVCLALRELKMSLPWSVIPWKNLEGFSALAHETALRAVRVDQSESVCGLSLLPFSSLTCLSSVEWSGTRYLLLLANLWSNFLSDEPPMLPLIKLGHITSLQKGVIV